MSVQLFERLKQERKRLLLTQDEMAAAGGVAKRTYCNYESGEREPPPEFLSKVVEAGADFSYLFFGIRSFDTLGAEANEERMISLYRGLHAEDKLAIESLALSIANPEFVGLLGKIATASGYAYDAKNNSTSTRESEPSLSILGGEAPEGFILVPHYEVQASAGGGTIVHSEQVVDYLAFKADWVRNTLGVAQKDLALISVKGDSMEPVLSNEDLILVDMRKNRVEDNAIYVLQLHGTLLVKRIQRKLDGALNVMSDNPRYETETVSAALASELNVLGRVVWSGRRM